MATLKERLDAIANKLKEAKAAYYTAVNNKESSTIINKAKAAFDEAQKAYDLSAPQRGDTTAAKEKMAYALREPYRNDIAAAKAKAATSTTRVTVTPKAVTPKAVTPTAVTPTAIPVSGKSATSGAVPQVTTATVTAKKVNDPNKSPGAAWTWDGSKWIKPPLPSKNKVYSWNDETGWKVKDEQVDVNFANLPANQQAAIGAIGENAVVPGQKTVKSRTPKYDKKGKLIGYDVTYTDGTIASEGPDSADDEVIQESGFNTDTIYTASDGTQFTNQQAYAIYQNDLTTRRLAGEAIAAEDLSKRTSAYDLLYNEFAQYGMGDLVADVKEFIMAGVSPSEFTMRLRATDPYKIRFKANEGRINAGLAAISEAEYIGLEDQYQNIMRNYGLPASYYTKGKYGVQEGFQKFIENDVSAAELEDRIMTAQQRVINSNPEVLASLKSFYPDITNGDILAYTLDPKNALDNIKRKVTAAEIGGAATQAGLNMKQTPEQIAAYAARAEELGSAGITKAQAQQGFETVAGGAPRGGQLASIYGENPYTQATAETEVFGLAGKKEAATQRKKVTGLEKATFGGQSGATSTALVRDRAGAY